MAEKFTKPEARGGGIHEHDVPEKAESVSDYEAIESTPSSIEQSIHQPNRLPPRPAGGPSKRDRRCAAAILEEYEESDLEEQKYRLRFCKQQIDCCRAMVMSSVEYLNLRESVPARFNQCTRRLTTDKEEAQFSEKATVPDGTEKLRENGERAIAILSSMENLEDIPLEDMVFIHDLYQVLVGGFHVPDEPHLCRCKYFRRR